MHTKLVTHSVGDKEVIVQGVKQMAKQPKAKLHEPLNPKRTRGTVPRVRGEREGGNSRAGRTGRGGTA